MNICQIQQSSSAVQHPVKFNNHHLIPITLTRSAILSPSPWQGLPSYTCHPDKVCHLIPVTPTRSAILSLSPWQGQPSYPLVPPGAAQVHRVYPPLCSCSSTCWRSWGRTIAWSSSWPACGPSPSFCTASPRSPLCPSLCTTRAGLKHTTTSGTITITITALWNQPTL